MKRRLILVSALILILLIVLGVEYNSLRRAKRGRDTAIANSPKTPPLHSLAQVSIEKFDGAILPTDWQSPRPRLWWHDNNESMRIYRERVEVMKRTGSFRSLPTLQPSKVEGLMESNQ